MTVYVSIGNSDDKLTQAQWAHFAAAIQARVSIAASKVHAYWTSSAVSPWQNACICADIPDAKVAELKQELAYIGRQYGQDSVAWAVAETEFLK